MKDPRGQGFEGKQTVRFMQPEAINRGHLKIKILVQSQGGFKFQSAGILLYFEELKREHNTEFGPKDIYEIVSYDFDNE